MPTYRYRRKRKRQRLPTRYAPDILNDFIFTDDYDLACAQMEYEIDKQRKFQLCRELSQTIIVRNNVINAKSFYPYRYSLHGATKWVFICNYCGNYLRTQHKNTTVQCKCCPNDRR